MNESLDTSNSSRSRWLGILRIVISLGLLVWALVRVGYRDVLTHAAGADYRLIGLAFALFNLGVLIRTARWAILLHGYGLRSSFRSLVLLNYGGTFFNTFLPTGFGGDFVRMAESGGVWREDKEVAAGVVLLDRFSGLSALFLLCLISLSFSSSLLPLIVFRALLAVAAFGLLLTLALIVSKPVLRKFQPTFRRLFGEQRAAAVRKVLVRFSVRHFLLSALVSIVFHILMILVHFALSRALGSEIPLILFGVFTPIVSLTLLLPSIQGLGLRENLYGFLVAGIGYPESLGVSIGLLVYAITVATGLFGGVLYLLFGIHKAAKEFPLKSEGRIH